MENSMVKQSSKNNTSAKPLKTGVVVTKGKLPTVQFNSERSVVFVNPQLAKQLKFVEYFAFNYSVIVGSFIRLSKSSSVKLFDQYVDNLIEQSHSLVVSQLDASITALEEYKKKGYKFNLNSNPQKVNVRIYRNPINAIVDMLIDLDNLLTILNYLEKTPYLSTPQLFKLVTDYSSIPKRLNEKLNGLINKLKKSHQYNVRVNNKDKSLQIDFGKINQMLVESKKHQFNLQDKKTDTVNVVKSEPPVIKEADVLAINIKDQEVTLQTSVVNDEKTILEDETSLVKNW
jgi:hypothetical protein